MAVGCGNLGVGDVAALLHQRLDDLARARRRKAPVGGERHDEERADGARQRLREVAAGAGGRIEVVQRLGDPQVGVGVEILGELLALVAQVGLDLELGREGEAQAFAQLATEFRLHLLVGQVGDVPDHPRHAQAAPRLHAVGVEVAVEELGIGEDRLARDLVERDVLGGEVRRRRDHQCVPDALRIADRPVERLHATEAAAHHRRPLPDAEAIGESGLRIDPVLDRHQREVGAPGRAGGGIGGQRPGRSEAAAEVVDADDEEPVRVERLARADHVVPPPDVVGGVGVVAGDVMRGVQRMADQHRIRALGIERAVRLVGELVALERAPAGEGQWLVEAHPLRDDRAHRAPGRVLAGPVPPVVSENDGMGNGGDDERGQQKTRPAAKGLIGWVACCGPIRFSRICPPESRRAPASWLRSNRRVGGILVDRSPPRVSMFDGIACAPEGASGSSSPRHAR